MLMEVEMEIYNSIIKNGKVDVSIKGDSYVITNDKHIIYELPIEYFDEMKNVLNKSNFNMDIHRKLRELNIIQDSQRMVFTHLGLTLSFIIGLYERDLVNVSFYNMNKTLKYSFNGKRVFAINYELFNAIVNNVKCCKEYNDYDFRVIIRDHTKFKKAHIKLVKLSRYDVIKYNGRETMIKPFLYILNEYLKRRDIVRIKY